MRSALHFSAAIGNVKVLQMLCQAGADVNLGDKDGACAPNVIIAIQVMASSGSKHQASQPVIDLTN